MPAYEHLYLMEIARIEVRDLAEKIRFGLHLAVSLQIIVPELLPNR